MDFHLQEVKSVSDDDRGTRKRKRDLFRRKYKTDNPNCFLEKENRTVFEKILRTPNSVDDIKWCIENGAKLYTVSQSKLFSIFTDCVLVVDKRQQEVSNNVRD
jgi:hypothetical protein